MDELTAAQLRGAFEVLQAIGAGPRAHLAIVGGLVPTLRTIDCDRVPASPHAGTTDVDLVVRLVMAAGATAAYYRGLTEALRTCGLQPENELNPTKPRWRWVGDRNGMKRRVELLAEPTHGGRPGQPATFHNVGEREGDDEVDLLLIPHSELAFHDRRTVTLDLELPGGTRPEAQFPVAGLGSWLILKRYAADNRGASPADDGRLEGKDYYDVAWMLLCLGPDAAAHELANSPLREREREAELLLEATKWLRRQFSRPENYGPGRYAAYLHREGHDIAAFMQFASSLRSVVTTRIYEFRPSNR